MKRIFACLLLFALSLGVFSACSGEQKSLPESKPAESVQSAASTASAVQDAREAAYNLLTAEQKQEVADLWKQAKASKVTLTQRTGTVITDPSYVGKEVYRIDFSTQRKSMPNNMIVYLSADGSKLVGLGLVD